MSHSTACRSAGGSQQASAFGLSQGIPSLALVVVLSLTPGCRDSSTTAETNLQDKKMTTLAISSMDNGTETRIGKLTFDDANNATLTIERSGPQADKLKKVWDEASKRGSLPMQWTERNKADDDVVTTRKSKEIPKSSDEYPNAVWSFLESGGHGFLVDKK